MNEYVFKLKIRTSIDTYKDYCIGIESINIEVAQTKIESTLVKIVGKKYEYEILNIEKL